MRFSTLVKIFVSVVWGLAMGGCQSTALTSAKLYLQENQPEKAKEQLLAAVEATPDDAQAHYLLGKVYALEGDWADMAASLDRASQLDSKVRVDAQRLRRYYWAQQYNAGVKAASAAEPDFEAARASFRAATTIDPRRVEAWRSLAYTYYRLGDRDRARQSYERAVEVAPRDSLSLSSLSTMCIQDQAYEQAAGLLEKLIAVAPEDAAAFVNLGIVREKLEDHAGAEKAFRRAISLDSTLSAAYYGLGNVFWNQKRYAEAVPAYRKAVLADSANTDARFNLAMAYLKLENDTAALPLLEQLSREMPDNGAVWRQLSLIYARQDRMEASRNADARAKAFGH